MTRPEPDPRFPSVRQAAIVLLLSLLASMLFGALARSIDTQYVFIGSRVVFILPLLLFLQQQNFAPQDLLRLRGTSLRVFGLGLFIGLCMALIGEELDRLMALLIPLPEELKKLLETAITASSLLDWIVLIGGVIILTALIEELLFRGFLQTALEARMDVTRAVMVTAFIFSLFYANPLSIVQIVVAGVVLGVLAWKSDSFLPSTAAHSMINATGITLALLGDASPQLLNWNGHIHPLVVLTAVAGLYFGMRLFYRFVDEDQEFRTFFNQPM